MHPMFVFSTRHQGSEPYPCSSLYPQCLTVILRERIKGVFQEKAASKPRPRGREAARAEGSAWSKAGSHTQTPRRVEEREGLTSGTRRPRSRQATRRSSGRRQEGSNREMRAVVAGGTCLQALEDSGRGRLDHNLLNNVVRTAVCTGPEGVSST